MTVTETMIVHVQDAKLVVTSQDWAEWQDSLARRLREADYFEEAAVLLDACDLDCFRTSCATVAAMLWQRTL